ncbi:hypothetical protein ABEB36_013408 [Hypothenemus hampei]|uniref:Uncharacterized protein n=1 Tax=Hypothenemus hampei TaxID=57062 RepID=A0ABD1E7X4_HYPHA
METKSYAVCGCEDLINYRLRHLGLGYLDPGDAPQARKISATNKGEFNVSVSSAAPGFHQLHID